MTLLRADERFRTGFDGVDSWHCFSAGPHYDPGNVAYGALIGVDEHVIAPGAGFGWHPHRGVTIVSVVASGRLRHEDDAGRARMIEPGTVLVQTTGGGVRHAETNASASRPLRLVQLTFVGDRAGGAAVDARPAPVDVGVARITTWQSSGDTGDGGWHLFVVGGAWRCGEHVLAAGDSLRGAGRTPIEGDGELLVCDLR